MALLGQNFDQYPWPRWVDRIRSSVIPQDLSIESMINSKIFDSGPQVLLSELYATFDVKTKIVSLKFSNHQINQLNQFLTSISPDSSVIFNLTFSPEADSHFFWDPKKSTTLAGIYSTIKRKDNQNFQTIGASFICFISSSKSDLVIAHEDGFVVMLKSENWATIRQCLSQGFNCRIKSDSDLGVELDIMFIDEVENENENF